MIDAELIHELANALTTIYLTVESASQLTHDLPIEEYLNSTLRHLEYVNSILLLNSIESDEEEGRLWSIDLSRTLETVINLFSIRAQKLNVSLELESRLPVTFDQYFPRLRQVIYNSVNNSLDAYQRQPGRERRQIVVSAELTRSEVVIRIRDWAGGIVAPVPNPGQLAPPAPTFPHQGLGLQLMRTIIERELHGRFHLQSHPDQDTTTLICLPLADPR